MNFCWSATLTPRSMYSSYLASSQARLPLISQLTVGSHWYSTSRPCTVPLPALVKSPKKLCAPFGNVYEVNTDSWMSSYLL